VKIKSVTYISERGKLEVKIMKTIGQRFGAVGARLANVRAGVRAALYQAAVELGWLERRRLVPVRVKAGNSKPNASLPF
jgi:hypothetical protein